MKTKLFTLGVLTIFLLGCMQTPVPPLDEHDDYHVHADLLVVLDGQTLDLNKTEYMSTPYTELHPGVHLHDFNPNVIHFHQENVTLNDFFDSIGMNFDSQCFNTKEQEFCNENQKKLFFYVNGQPNNEFENYVPNDLDKILIYFGESAPSQETFGQISNQACIYSEKCEVPPGFVLPPESCSISKPCVLPA